MSEFGWAHPLDQPLDGTAERRGATLRSYRSSRRSSRRRADGACPEQTGNGGKHRSPPLTALQPVAPTGGLAALHGVPGQRPNYLRRQEYLDRLKQALLGATNRAVGITGTAAQGAPVGLHGMGGIGKTELAKGLVNDDEVRHAFPDGIFWLTLGQKIEPLQLQGELAAYVRAKPGPMPASTKRATGCANCSTANRVCWCSTICGGVRMPSRSMSSGRARGSW